METNHRQPIQTEINALEVVANLAYQRWEAEGRPSGRNLDIWSWAEDQLLASQAPANYLPASTSTSPSARL
jgi:hypothetical protein